MKVAHTLLKNWGARVSARIAAKIADARAHAENALTETLKGTPDGRATALKANRSRSLLAAQTRLQELLVDLAGPTTISLEGLVRDAREAFYRDATARTFPLIPSKLLARSDPTPTRLGLSKARGLVLHGQDIHSELQAPISAAGRNLAAAVVLAGNQSTSKRAGRNRLDDWARTAKASIERAATLALGDSRVALEVIAGRDLVRSEFLDKTPLTIGA